MTWAKLDDRFPRHPKAVGAGPLPCWLYVCSLCYANEHLTDGFIPAAAVATLAPGMESPHEVAEILVKFRLWEHAEGGFRIHDFGDFNPSAEYVRAQRKATARRVKDWRARNTGTARSLKRMRNGVTDPGCDAVGNAAPTPTPTPTPTYTPTQDAPSGPPRGARAPVDQAAHAWLDLLNHEAGRAFKPVEANLRPIRARIGEGFTLEQAAAVVRHKAREWAGTDQDQYLRPLTLFGTKFDSYLQAARNGSGPRLTPKTQGNQAALREFANRSEATHDCSRPGAIRSRPRRTGGDVC